MDMNNDNETSKEGCCPMSIPEESCSDPQASNSPGGKPSGNSWSKTIVFALVMLAALGVGVYSFSKNGAAGSGNSEKTMDVSIADEEIESSAFAVTPGAKLVPTKESATDRGVAATPGCITTDNQSSKAGAFSCGENLNSLKVLDKMTAGKGTVFLLLPGEEEESSKKASQQVENIIETLKAKGKQVAAFTLERDSEQYDEIVKRFSIESLPCVIVSGLEGQSLMVSQDITEEKLTQAFVLANMSTPGCTTPCEPESATK